MRTQSVSQDETGSQNESLVDESSMRTQSASQDEEGSQNEQSVGAQSDNDTESEIIETEVLNEPSTKPGYKTSFEYQLADGQKGQATVLPKLKQPKPTSKFRNWLNVRNVESNKDSSINWDNIVWWKPSCGEQVLTVTQIQCMDEDKMIIAKDVEIKNLHDNDVYEWVEDKGQDAISSRWVMTEKNEGGESIIKARLVARGFEETHNERTDSPTCSKQSVRLLFSIASTFSWEVRSIDIKAAFLQGDLLDREVFVVPPEDQSLSGKIWRLKRCIYGLCDAPRSWYKRVKHELVDTLGGKVSKFDKAFFIWHDTDGKLRGIIALHVDDFVFCGRSEWLVNVINKLMTVFKISKSSQGCFRYLGLNVKQTSGGIYIDQHDYVDEIDHVVIDQGRVLQKDAPLNKKEVKRLKGASGKLLWVSSNTRPDIAYDSCVISNYGKTPTVKNLLAANKGIDKLKKSQLKLVFPDLGNPDLWKINVYCDAAHANLPNGGSQGGFLVFIEGNERLSPLVWRSKKLDRVTKSPLASEAMSFAEAADAGYLISEMIKEVCGRSTKVEINCFSDSKSLKDHLESSNIISDLRLRVDMARMQEMVELKEIQIIWVAGRKQLADALTKHGASAALLMEVLGKGFYQ
jgi:hypothetical protein